MKIWESLMQIYGLRWKSGGLSCKFVVSDENLGVSYAHLWSPMKIWGSLIQICGLLWKSGGFTCKCGVSDENLGVFNENLGTLWVLYNGQEVSNESWSRIVLLWRWFLPRRVKLYGMRNSTWFGCEDTGSDVKSIFLKNAIILHLNKQKYNTYIWLSITLIKYFNAPKKEKKID